MYRLSENDLILVNKGICNTFHQDHSVLNFDALSSCLNAYDSYYEDDNHISSAIFRSIITNHPFKDGNKRTAFLVLQFINFSNIGRFNIANLAIEIAKNTSMEVDDICNILYPTVIKESYKNNYIYEYAGPVYRFEKLYDNIREPIYTTAKSKAQAINNFKKRLKDEYNLVDWSKLDIDDDKVLIVEFEPEDNSVQDLDINQDNQVTTINGKPVYFQDGYYIIDNMKFIDEDEIKAYLGEAIKMNETYTFYSIEKTTDGNFVFDSFHIVADNDAEAMKKAMAIQIANDENDEEAVIDILDTYGYSLDETGVKEYLTNTAIGGLNNLIIYGIKDSDGNLILDNGFDNYENLKNNTNVDEDFLNEANERLTPQDKQDLQKLLQVTDDPEMVQAVVDAKTKDKKNEDLNEAFANYYLIEFKDLDDGRKYSEEYTAVDRKEALDLFHYDYPPEDGYKFLHMYKLTDEGWENVAINLFDESLYDQVIESGFEKTLTSLDEASYGGAYDIEDDMFFTKDDLNEFLDHLIEKLDNYFGYSFDVYNAGFDSPTDLYLEIVDTNNDIILDTHVNIDMRKIRSPKDLNKYLNPTFMYFYNGFKDFYDQYNFDESLNEDRLLEKVRNYVHSQYGVKNRQPDLYKRGLRYDTFAFSRAGFDTDGINEIADNLQETFPEIEVYFTGGGYREATYMVIKEKANESLRESLNEAYIDADKKVLDIIRRDEEYNSTAHVKTHIPDFSAIPDGTVITLKGLNKYHPKVKAIITKIADNDWNYTYEYGEGSWDKKLDNYGVMREIRDVDKGAYESLNESLHEKLDLSDYKELSYPLRDGGKNYQIFRKLENGTGRWAAAPIEMGDVKYDDAFEITYNQARGFEPINTIGKLSRDLGNVLLPKRESFTDGKLNPGDKFKNKNDVIITIIEPAKDGTIQFKIGDEVRSGTEKGVQRMLYKNNYVRINEEMNEGRGSSYYHMDKELEQKWYENGLSFYEMNEGVYSFKNFGQAKQALKIASKMYDDCWAEGPIVFVAGRSKKNDINEAVLGVDSYIGKPLKDYLASVDHKARVNIVSDNGYDFYGKNGNIAGMNGLAHDVPWYIADKKVLSIETPEDTKYYDVKILIEDYQNKDDEWGEPYTYEEVEEDLKSLTHNWTDKEGTIRCYYEQEKQYGVQVLKQHYKTVETSDGRTGIGQDMSWAITYKDPKKEIKENLDDNDLNESLTHASKLLRNKLISCINHFMKYQMKFPKDSFLAYDWHDLKDGIEMGIDSNLYEIAEGILEYIEPFTREVPGEDGFFDEEIKLYNSLKAALNYYLTETGYDPLEEESILNEDLTIEQLNKILEVNADLPKLSKEEWLDTTDDDLIPPLSKEEEKAWKERVFGFSW